MKNRSQPKSLDEKTIRDLLEKHGCPTPFHEVRALFLGNIATPDLTASPMRIVEGLWGGELPAFDSMDEANELISVLVQGVWNDLTKHQKRTQPFRLTRLTLDPTPKNLEASRVFRRLLSVRRSPHDDKEQVFA